MDKAGIENGWMDGWMECTDSMGLSVKRQAKGYGIPANWVR